MRLHKPDNAGILSRSALRPGDIIYHPPNRSTQHTVAVVYNVCRAYGGVGYGGSQLAGPHRTGSCDLMFWDLTRLQFGRLQREVPCSGFVLLPPCCGRGLACDSLYFGPLAGRWQWPNGDLLNLELLRPIPERFASLLRETFPLHKQRRPLEEIFKVLLGPHYTSRGTEEQTLPASTPSSNVHTARVEEDGSDSDSDPPIIW